jgi:hypothetical protein
MIAEKIRIGATTLTLLNTIIERKTNLLGLRVQGA